MQRTFGQSFSGFPDAPVAPGATWTNTSEIRAADHRHDEYRPDLDASGGRDDRRIGDGPHRGRLALKQSAEAPATAEMPMKITMGEAKGTGEMTFDVTNGRAQRTTVDMDMPMTMAMTTPDGEFMSIQNSVHTTMVMELVRR